MLWGMGLSAEGFWCQAAFFVTEGFFGGCEVDFLGAKECFWGPRGVLAALRDVF